MTTDRNLGFDVNAPGTSLFVLQLVFLTLAWITSLMRAFVKLVLLRKVTVDDYTMLLALLGYTASAYFVFVGVTDGGLGKSLARLSPESAEIMLKTWFVKKWHKIVLHAVISVTTVTTTTYFFLVVFQCSPPSHFWEVSKVGIAAILSFGIISGIALVVRLIYVKQSGPASKDPGAGIIAVGVSAIVELALGIIAGCIATLPPLFKKIGLQCGPSSKRLTADTIPWQRSFATPENIIMMSPRRLERDRDARDEEVETRRTGANSPSAKRVLSSPNWDIDVEVAGVEDGTVPPPSGKVQVRTMIHVSSQPSDGNLSVSTVDFVDKPLPPPPPPRPAVADRSTPRSRRLTPNLF
ncbi:hypothetical protein EKO27_g6029 [Xylaria grammica]|uniref:Rhodopsin domain-containing protein n=1 Tax=Xylaria grammica TaxID=363999 RepID=A0A439D3U6_9PEZI|nr:hypothetical protein EKO27_g6029 [Xylaria grammica]